MFTKTLTAAAAFAVAIVAFDPAFAAKSGQPSFNGQATNVGLVGENNTVAMGLYSDATTRVGGIQDGRFNGRTVNVGLIGENNTVALGIGAEAGTDVGQIYNARSNGDLANIGLIGENNTVSLGIGTKAKTEVGTLGKE